MNQSCQKRTECIHDLYQTTTYSSRRTPVRATLFRPTPVDGLTLAQKPQELPPSRLIRPIRLRFMWEHWVRSSKAWIAARTGKPSTPGKKDEFFSAIAINPRTPSTIYTGTDGSVYKSMDGGVSWSVKSNGLDFNAVQTLAINPNTPATLYAGTHDGVYRTTNGGENWSLVCNGKAI